MELSALERMTRLLEVTAALSKTMTPDQVADVVLRMGLSAVGAQRGALLTFDEDERDYVLLEHDRDAPGPPAVKRLQADSEVPIVRCARSGKPVAPGPGRMCLPLLIRGHPIGAIELCVTGDDALDAQRRALFEATADSTAQALERARLYALEQLRREELERSNRLKDDFLGIVSHELRTPLSAILGWSRMLKRGIVTSTEGQDRALEAIERNATLQARLVDDLLDVSRIVSGKLDLEMTSVDLAAVVDAAIDSVRPTLLAKGLEVRLDIASGAYVLGDARRLQQVVWNLLTNAIKFTPQSGHIDVRLSRKGRIVRLSVRDDGEGIEPDVLPRIFERFRQGDASSTREHGGLGLGLAIVRHVIEAHGGAVSAFSEGEGQGAEVIVELPLGEADSMPNLRAADSLQIRVSLSGTRVLLVDDDKDTRDFLAAALTSAGAELRAVGDAATAFDLVISWRPEVIVSDIAMPQQDGYTLIRRIRALPADQGGRMPAVALTALARPKDRVRALAAGFQTHLPKPVDPSELVLVVANLRQP
jgi:signal transduction histidine kinase/ActR/RegA family two-component response regulator